MKYLKRDVSRHGKPRLYVRMPGRPMIRLPVDSEDDPEFGPAYAAALNGVSQIAPAPETKKESAKPPLGSLRACAPNTWPICTRPTR